jgi:hypothetical protein
MKKSGQTFKATPVFLHAVTKAQEVIKRKRSYRSDGSYYYKNVIAFSGLVSTTLSLQVELVGAIKDYMGLTVMDYKARLWRITTCRELTKGQLHAELTTFKHVDISNQCVISLDDFTEFYIVKPLGR